MIRDMIPITENFKSYLHVAFFLTSEFGICKPFRLVLFYFPIQLFSSTLPNICFSQALWFALNFLKLEDSSMTVNAMFVKPFCRNEISWENIKKAWVRN